MPQPQVDEHGVQGRRWCWTINNPEKEDVFSDPLPDGIRYAVWQKERAPTTGTEHLQGYLETTGPWRRSRVLQALGGHAWVALAREREAANTKYCTKAGRVAGPWVLGEPGGVRQGARTDLKPLDQAVEQVANGASLAELDPIVVVRHGQGLSRLINLQRPPMRDDFTVCVIRGESGIGKTWWVYNRFPEVYRPNYGNGGIWWDGYSGQDTILIDEFKGQCPLQKLLMILDRYPLMLEVKGGYTPAKYRTVFVTVNSDPVSWYPNGNQYSPQEFQALLRRVGLVPHPETRSYYITADSRADLHKRLNDLFPLPAVEEIQQPPTPAASLPDEEVEIVRNPANGDTYAFDKDLDNHPDMEVDEPPGQEEWIRDKTISAGWYLDDEAEADDEDGAETEPDEGSEDSFIENDLPPPRYKKTMVDSIP